MGYAPHSGRGGTATKGNIEGGRVLGTMAWGSGRGNTERVRFILVLQPDLLLLLVRGWSK